MPVYHIHINGLVQGVGFRPTVHQLAIQMGIDGWVRNGSDGVHILCKTNEENAKAFYQHLLQNPPGNAIISKHLFELAQEDCDQGFHIVPSTREQHANMMLTPDLAPCDHCRKSIASNDNRRQHYAFTTCLQCGPRYSITRSLPYDRANTSMAEMKQCPVCLEEYHLVTDHRHHSQTNSCKHCAIQMHLYNEHLIEIPCTQDQIPEMLAKLVQEGKILAIKAVGGYLLVCDAANKDAVAELRKRKHRPSKPFALLYADIEMLQADLSINTTELSALKDKAAPIVLCNIKNYPENNLDLDGIAPGLSRLGAMLPASPLLQLLANSFGKPMVATSGNLSGSPILYQDSKAKEWLLGIADYLLSYDREILTPQDDSLIQFSSRGQKIILRRSRGLAPNFYPINFQIDQQKILAMGAELKSSFAIATGEQIFVSQFLGDQQSLESQMAFEDALNQVSELLNFEPTKILIDQHPGYQVSEKGKKIGLQKKCQVISIQHHEAHFAAVLAENKLLDYSEPVLGFIWDGAGYGHDGQVWGGEVFLYDQGSMHRAAHLAYFPQILGNKMNKEPRLSALSILKDFPLAQKLIRKHFTDTEWHFYQQVLAKPVEIQTSSMGRLIDAVACILGLTPIAGFEGEAAMQLESLANKCPYPSYDAYHLPIAHGIIDWRPLIQEILHDWQQKEPNEVIAWKFFYSLAKAIAKISGHFFIDKLAFSGGVFQNAILTDLILEQLQQKRALFFHQQLSPNDECISLGQLAWHSRFYQQEHALEKQTSIKYLTEQS